MDKKILAKIKANLLLEKKQVLNDFKKISNNKNKNDKARAKFPDFGDKLDENALEVGEYTTNLATEKVLQDSLRDIENALQRIEKGTYGVCKYCGKEINEKRLLARPVASACIECKNKLQKAA
jgi:RNA polymerase-binding protein DksA